MDIDLFTNYLSDIKDRVLSEPIELFTNCTDVDEIIKEENFEDTLSDLRKFQLVSTGKKKT